MTTLDIFLLSIQDIVPGKEDFINKIFPNGFAPVIIQLVATAVMFLVAAKFLFKPVRKILQARQEYVETQIKSAAEENAQAKENQLQSKAAILVSKKEAKQIVEQAKLDSQKVKDTALLQLEKELHEKRVRAEKEIEQEKEQAKEEIRQEMVNLAMTASEQLLAREVNKKDHQAMVSDFIEDMYH